MSSHAFRIHGAGCGGADFIHPNIDFNSPRIKPYHSLSTGDGGLEMGKVIFVDDLVRFSNMQRAAGWLTGTSWQEILNDITGDDPALPIFNAGGPAAASLTAAAQLLRPSRTPVTWYGITGNDGHAARLRHTLSQTPLDLTCLRQRLGQTPSAHVFNDPQADQGRGDRFFVFQPGNDFPYQDAFQGESFFQAVITLYAGTALLPALHKALPDLLRKSRRRGAITVVGPVFDVAAEKSAPNLPWPMGEGDAFPFVDLLVADAEELRGLAGLDAKIPKPGMAGTKAAEAEDAVEAGVDLLLKRGLTSVVVTRGAHPVYYRSLGGIFGKCQGYVPVEPKLAERIQDREGNPGDTTGAGDNFLAGILTDMIKQLLVDDFYPKGETHVERELLEISPLHLRHAVEFGVLTGGLACLQVGGVVLEKHQGEKLAAVHAFLPPPLPAGRRPW